MKHLLSFLIFFISLVSFAQYKKDGTPDMRYKTNKQSYSQLSEHNQIKRKSNTDKYNILDEDNIKESLIKTIPESTLTIPNSNETEPLIEVARADASIRKAKKDIDKGQFDWGEVLPTSEERRAKFESRYDSTIYSAPVNRDDYYFKTSTGKEISKYPSIKLGIDNEDYWAKNKRAKKTNNHPYSTNTFSSEPVSYIITVFIVLILSILLFFFLKKGYLTNIQNKKTLGSFSKIALWETSSKNLIENRNSPSKITLHSDKNNLIINLLKTSYFVIDTWNFFDDNNNKWVNYLIQKTDESQIRAELKIRYGSKMPKAIYNANDGVSIVFYSLANDIEI